MWVDIDIIEARMADRLTDDIRALIARVRELESNTVSLQLFDEWHSRAEKAEARILELEGDNTFLREQVEDIEKAWRNAEANGIAKAHDRDAYRGRAERAESMIERQALEHKDEREELEHKIAELDAGRANWKALAERTIIGNNNLNWQLERAEAQLKQVEERLQAYLTP